MKRREFQQRKEQAAQDNLEGHYQDLLNKPQQPTKRSGGKRLPRRGKNSRKGKGIYKQGQSGRNAGGRNLFHKL